MYYDGFVHVEPEDQCFSCEYFVKGIQCPLLEALGAGVVSLDGEVVVQNCGFFKEFKRSLRVVGDTPEKDEEISFTPEDDNHLGPGFQPESSGS